MKNHLLDIMIFKEPIGSMNTRGFNNFSALAVGKCGKKGGLNLLLGSLVSTEFQGPLVSTEFQGQLVST